MTKPTAFKATYADFKLIKTRGVVQVVLEVPLAESDMAYQVLGGMPNPAKETWFGIAALKAGTAEKQQLGVCEAYGDPKCVGVCKDPRDCSATPDKPVAIRKAVAPDKKLAQQAGIACRDPVFWKFVRERCCWDCNDESDAADYVRKLCAVGSRAEIIPGTRAEASWRGLYGDFLAWRDNPDLVPDKSPATPELEHVEGGRG